MHRLLPPVHALVLCALVATLLPSFARSQPLGPEPDTSELKAVPYDTYTTLYLSGDGALHSAIINSAPDYYHTPTGLQRINTQLVPDVGGSARVRNAAGPFDARLATSLPGAQGVTDSGTAVSLALAGQLLELSPLETMRVRGSVKDSSIHYAGLAPGRSWDVTVSPTGLDSITTLAQPPSADAMHWRLRLREGTATLQTNGSITVTPCSDACVTFLRPVLIDAAGQQSDGVKVALTPDAQEPNQYRLSYSFDEAWLRSADRTFPVLLDTSLIIRGPEASFFEGYFKERAAREQSCNSERQFSVGYDATPTRGLTRAYIAFKLPNLPNAQITQALLHINQYATHANASEYTAEVYQVLENWVDGCTGFSWERQPLRAATPLARQTITATTGAKQIDILPAVDAWEAGAENFGLAFISAQEAERRSGSYFCASAAANSGLCGLYTNDKLPYVELRFNQPDVPPTPPPPPPPAPTILVTPGSLPVDSGTATVTLMGATPGHRIRFRSSRGSVDRLSPLTGVVDESGRLSATIRSSHDGSAIIHAEDLTRGQTFASWAQVTFTPVNSSTPPSQPPINHRPVTIDVKASRDLSGLYPVGLGELMNEMTVTVDWGGRAPGRVRYQFNASAPVEDAVNGNRITRKFDFSRVLRLGVNTLSVIAIAADGTQSSRRDFTMVGWTAEAGWLQSLIASRPYLGPETIEFTLHIPGEPLKGTKIDMWLPGRPSHLRPQAIGKVKLPLMGGPYEAGIGLRFERDRSTPGRKPWYGRDAFKLIGRNDLELELTGAFAGTVGSTPPYVSRPEQISVDAKGKVTFEVSESLLIALEPVVPGITASLRSLGPLYDAIKDRGKVYIQLAPEIGGNLGLGWGGDELKPVRISVYVQADVEAGLKGDLFIGDFKAYLGGGLKATFIVVPETGFDKVTFYGKAGYEARVLWFSTKREFELWNIKLYDRSAAGAQFLPQADVLHDPEASWAFIRRTTDSEAVTAVQVLHPSAALASVDAFTASPLTSPVFPEADSALAQRPDGQTLMLWADDDPAQLSGRSYDLRYRRWNGEAWSEPAWINDDAQPDGAPQVVWLDDIRALAVWQRLDDAALAADASLTITHTAKLDLAWSLYDANTDQWGAPQWLTRSPGVSDWRPVLSQGPDGTVMVAWVSNDSGAVGGTDAAPDRILTARWNGSGWESQLVAVARAPGVADLTLAHESGAATLVWAAPQTVTGIVTPTLQLAAAHLGDAGWSTSRPLTSAPDHQQRPSVVYAQGQAFLAWLTGERLALQRVDLLEATPYDASGAVGGDTVLLPGNLQVDEMRLAKDSTGNIYAVLTAQRQQQRDLYLAYYDVGLDLWGLPQPLTASLLREEDPTIVLGSDGAIFIGYTGTVIERRVESLVGPGATEPVTVTVPLEGASGLYSLRYELRTDLTASALTVTTTLPDTAGTVPVVATIVNSGDRPLRNVAVQFFDGGAAFARQELAGVLRAGEAVSVTVRYPVPVDGGVRKLSVVVDPDQQIAEGNEANNTVTLDALGPDLELHEASVQLWGGTNAGIVVVVGNLGPMSSPPATLTITPDSGAGPLVTAQVPALASGQILTLTTPLDFGNLPEGRYPLTATVNASDFAELDRSNNQAGLTLQVRPDLMVAPEYLWAKRVGGSVLRATSITATVINTGPIVARDVLVEVYARPLSEGSRPLFTRTISQISPGEQVVVSGEVLGNLRCGVVLWVNPDRRGFESTYANNIASTADVGGDCTFTNYLPLVALGS